ncbi:MAG: PAS domain S-box protein [Actinobacteria bacterium]|nr:PAS domain S-box protein [Actinomycetota bacterium]
MESESLYRALFELNLDGVMMTATDGRILDANPAACTMLQMSREEICAAGRAGIIKPGPEVDEAVAVRRQSGSCSGVFTFVRKDGSTFPAEFSSVVLPGTGDPPLTFVVFHDISKRVAIEAELRESEARLVQAQAVAHVGNWELDLPTRMMWASAEALRIYGLETRPSDFTHKLARTVPLPQEHARLDKALGDLVGDGAPYDLEFRIKRPSDGAIRLIHSTAELIRDESGAPHRVVGIIEDVTERRRAEEMLRLTKYSVDHAADAVLWSDADGRLIFVSESTSHSLGYTSEALLSMTLFDINPTLTAERLARNRETLKRTGASRFETVHRTKQGREFPVEVSLNLMTYEGVEYHCAIARDVSDRRQAEAALRESEERLQQSQKMEAVGQLAGGIAHDFNNLLTAIIGYSEMVLADETIRTLPTWSDVCQIRAAAERAGGLTRQILAFSRRQALRPSVVSLNDILTGLEPLLRRTLGEDVELLSRQEAGLALVEVDRHQFEQVLMNLAVNARDAMPLGGRLVFETGNVEIGENNGLLQPDMKPGDYVMLTVADTGIGMDMETASHVFEPFFTTKSPGEGTGLGLSTVYGIVRQSGGSIDIRSEPGVGTTFRVFLPRAARTVPEAPGTGAEEEPFLGSETILVVEDDAALRSLVFRVLEAYGYTPLMAEDADGALKILEDGECRVDLLLTDIVLPGRLRGDVLAQRAVIIRPGLPVLHMSGYTSGADLGTEGLQEGVNFIAKPFTPEKLAKMLRAVLDRSRAGLRA